MVERVLARGRLKAEWVAGDDAFGVSPSFRDALAALGMHYVLDVPAGFTVWPPEPEWTSPAYQGRGALRQPRLARRQRRTMAAGSDELPENAWPEIAVAPGSQGSPGSRRYRFSAQRVRPTSRRKPGAIHWAVYRRNRDGSEPRYYLSNRRTRLWRPWPEWAGPGGALRRSLRPRSAAWGWTSTRPAPRIKYGAGSGRAGIITSPCACWRGLSS